jgi:sigma-B regulation protein RsbU (phosphoserine phosphatase)
LPDAPQSITLAAASGSLSAATEFVRKGAAEAELPQRRMGELDLVVEEVVINLSRYAYPDGAGDVTISYSVPAPGALRVEFADQGREFDPLAASPPDLTLDLSGRPIGGLGIFLVKAFADSLTYRREDGWNRLALGISAGARS